MIGTVLSALAFASASQARPQPSVQPIRVPIGSETEQVLLPNRSSACFMVDARALEEIEISVSSVQREGAITVARGTSCAAAPPVAQANWTLSSAGRASVRPNGAPLILIIRNGSPGGIVKLAVKEVVATSGFAAPRAATRSSDEPAAMTASGFAAPTGNANSAERQALLAQAANGERRVIAAPEEVYRPPAEPEPQQPQVDTGALVMNALTQTLNGITRDTARNTARIEQQTRDIQAMTAQRRAQSQPRVIPMPSASAAPRTATIVASRPPVPTPSSAPPPRPVTPPAELIVMMEGVVVCPLNPDRAKLFGESTCHGPFQNVLADPRKAYDIALACGSSDRPVRDLGMYGNNRVWGCEYGINPRKSGSPNIDQAARFGLVIPSRRTFRCDSKISGYCRN